MRLRRIDAFRFYAIAGVVWVHAPFFGSAVYSSRAARLLEAAVSQGVRFSMPFFFSMAGFFLGPRLLGETSNHVKVATSYTKRLLVPFLFWCAVYAIEEPLAARDWSIRLTNPGQARDLILHHWKLLAQHPLRLLLEGTCVHLWFVVSLLMVLWIYVLVRRMGASEWHFVALGVALFTIGVLGGAYGRTRIGFSSPVDTRDGPFFGTLFFAVGLLFAKSKPRVGRVHGFLLAAVGVTVTAIELYVLRRQTGIRFSILKDTDYVFGTALYGIGMTLAALAPVETRLDRVFGPLGRYTFGVYLSHIALVGLFRPLRFAMPPTAWLAVIPVLALAASLVFTRVTLKTALKPVVGG